MSHQAVETLRSDELRNVFSRWHSGVVAACATVDRVPLGLTLSSFVPVSLDPPLCALSVSRDSHTWSRLRTAPAIGISVLSAGQADVARALAATVDEKLGGIAVREDDDGAVVLAGACAWFVCQVTAEHPTGDHLLTVLDILRIGWEPGEPLLYGGRAYGAVSR